LFRRKSHSHRHVGDANDIDVTNGRPFRNSSRREKVGKVLGEIGRQRARTYLQKIVLLQSPGVVGIVRRAQKDRRFVGTAIAYQIFAMHQHTIAGDAFYLRDIGE
jgi:hypothetical protein